MSIRHDATGDFKPPCSEDELIKFYRACWTRSRYQFHVLSATLFTALDVRSLATITGDGRDSRRLEAVRRPFLSNALVFGRFRPGIFGVYYDDHGKPSRKKRE